MNQVIKISKRVALVSFGVVIISGAVPAFAVEKTTTQTKESAFCTELSANAAKITSGIATTATKWTAAKSQRILQMTTNDAKWDQAITANRAKWDQQRQADFTKLEAKAKTTAQMTATKVYETTIINDVAARRAAYDQARLTYRQAVMQDITTRQSVTDGQVSTLKASADSAIAAATEGCVSAPTTGPAIRTAFQARLKAAREAYTASRKGDETTTGQIKQLGVQRDASFKVADNLFETAAKAAQAILRAAFKDTTL